MRKFYFLLLTILMSFASFGQVFITEIGDPNDTSAIRFIELYNAGDTDVDLSTGWKLEKYLNDATEITTHSVSLTGTITSKGFYILAVGVEDSNFNDAFGFPPNQWEGSDEYPNQTTSNGDDPIQLVNGSTIVDLYGVPGTDGTGQPWEFEDGRAARKATVTAGNTTFDINEWEIDSDQPTGNGAQNVADGRLNPGAWAGTTLSNETFEQLGFKMYPNPVNDGFLYINSKTLGEKTIDLFDLSGRSILKVKLKSNRLDVSHVKSGFYVLKISSGDRWASSKLIIK
jgi:hypothetical protein